MGVRQRQLGPSSEDLGEEGVGPSQMHGQSVEAQVERPGVQGETSGPGDAEQESRRGTAQVLKDPIPRAVATCERKLSSE